MPAGHARHMLSELRTRKPTPTERRLLRDLGGAFGPVVLRYLWLCADRASPSLWEQFGPIPGYLLFGEHDGELVSLDHDPGRGAYGLVAVVTAVAMTRAGLRRRAGTEWRWASALLQEAQDVIAGRKKQASYTWRATQTGSYYHDWSKCDLAYSGVLRYTLDRERKAAEMLGSSLIIADCIHKNPQGCEQLIHSRQRVAVG